MTYREIKKTFIQFLKKNNALESYKKNVIECNKHKKITLVNRIDPLTIPSIKENILSANVFWSIISASFVWADTKEGHKFWSHLNNKWSKISHEYKITSEQITDDN